MIKTPLNLIAPAVRVSAFRRRTLSRIKSHRAPLRLHAPVPPHPLILAAALYRDLNLIAIWYNVRIEDDARDRNFANAETAQTLKPHRT